MTIAACLSEADADEVARVGDVSRRAPAIAEHLDSCTNCRELVSALALVHAADAAPTKLFEGAQIGRYVLHRLLGEGGMGVVWEAQDAQLGRRVALKWIHPTRGQDADRERARLLREARIVASLDHANTVTVFDAGEIDGETFIALELAPNGTLAQWLRAEPRAPAAILRAFVAAGRGLAAAHRKGIVHGDFKAENVLRSTDDIFKVTDFGLARSSGEHGSSRSVTDAASRVTSTALGGTPFYMPPERLAGGAASERADQYSLAIAMWCALAGSLTKPSAGRLPGVSIEIERTLRRGAAEAPEARFASVAELLDALEVRPRALWPRLVVAAVVVSLIGGGVALLRKPAVPPLVTNGGMELGAEAPASWALTGNTAGYTVARVTDGAHGGKARAVVRPTAAPGAGALLSQAVDVRALRGKHLHASAWIRIEGSASKSSLLLRARNVPTVNSGPTLAVASTALASEAAWKRYDVELDVPTTASFVDLGISVNDGATLSVDDVSLVDDVAFQPPPSKVKNGDLESADAAVPAEWLLSGGAAKDFELVRALDQRHAGAASAVLQRKTKENPSPSGAYATAMQVVDVRAVRDRRIRLVAWLRKEGVATRADFWTRARGNMTGGDGAMLGSNSADLTGAVTEWTRYEVVLDIPPEALFLDVGFGLTGDAKLWFDDVAIEVVGK